MKAIHEERYGILVRALVVQRKAMGLSQQEVADKLGIDQSNVSRYEKCELRLDIELLAKWCVAIDVFLDIMLSEAGYIPGGSGAREPKVGVNINNEVAYPVQVKEAEDGIDLVLRWRDSFYDVYFPEISVNNYLAVESAIVTLFSGLNAAAGKMKNRDVIAEALHMAISMLPEANPSDIYHHVVYRLYIREYNLSDPKQSWVRSGGAAVEQFFKRHYGPLLAPHGIFIQLSSETGVKNKFLIEMGIADQVAGSSKLDICLYGTGKNGLVSFGGVHSKASLAERVSDDKPCSERMMAAGYKSYLFTFDAKSYPPPTGTLVNVGELGTIESPSDKRDYIEKHGSFDACFSYNTRTVPSGPVTQSGKRIFSSRFDSSDALVYEVVSAWQLWRAANNL